MKPIELTQEHKTKLLEMCKELFPEYGEVQLLESYCATEYDATGSPYLRWYIPHIHEGKNTTKLIEIHWFEFCMTHLAEKLLNPNPNKPSRTIKEHFAEFYWFMNLFANNIGGQHPIDYLYEEFQKLKL